MVVRARERADGREVGKMAGSGPMGERFNIQAGSANSRQFLL